MAKRSVLVAMGCFAAALAFIPIALAQGLPATQPAAAVSATPFKIDTGDTAWVLAASALVMLMTPGLALFYGGMVRSKNVTSTIMQVFFILALVSLQWAIIGYTLAFGPDHGHIIGGLDWAFLNGVSATSPNMDYAPTIPHQAFMIFQAMFAIITPALIIGAVAERMKFSAIAVFVLLWATVVYDPIAHSVWGVGGYLRSLGAIDFAGGLVVHVSSGIAALACALYLGKRLGHGSDKMEPHNLTLVVLGTGLLWFGWFGFNAGSAVASGSLATVAFVTTHMATAAAALSWAFVEWRVKGKPSLLGAASGAVAGLVAITPASGFVTPMAAILIGLAVGAICFYGVQIKTRLGFDDALDAFGVHGVGGIFGALATGVFATLAVNAAGADGLLYGSVKALGAQVLAILIVCAFSFAMTWVILIGIDKTIGIRVSEGDERAGLDMSLHGEVGYHLE